MNTRFRLHYKDKPYKYLGVAKHSETMEELTVYECLYENPTGKLWVRPREMFESNVTPPGRKEIPRFRHVPLQIEVYADFASVPWPRLQALLKEVFGEADQEKIRARLEGKTAYLLIGRFENRDAGFKIAYQKDQATFESWLGGVRPEFRGLGVGGSLLQNLEAYARSRGCTRLQTKTLNKWTEMLVLNLRRGFQITGTEDSARGLKILLEKNLV